MPKRKLRIVKPTPMMIGICERCNSQFKADSREAIETAFRDHICEAMDSSQNALRIVRESTEGK